MKERKTKYSKTYKKKKKKECRALNRKIRLFQGKEYSIIIADIILRHKPT